MYICIYVSQKKDKYVHVFIRMKIVCMYACANVCVCKFVCIYMCVCVYIWLYRCMYVCVDKCILFARCMYVCMYVS